MKTSVNMRDFKYDIVQLIHAVRDRPCLWDRTLEIYKDRAERRAAWEEVFGLIEERYEEMTAEEKRVTGELLLNKWTNVRDTFVKTLKNKMGKPRRRYLLYDHLKFLIKVVSVDDDYTYAVDFNADDSSSYTMKAERESPKESSSHRKRSKRSDHNEDEPKKSKEVEKPELDYVEVEECNDPRIMNEDEAFFASLLPSVVKYSEDERLEFRMEVLAVMKKIKEKRVW